MPRKAGGRRDGAGRKPQLDARTVPRMIRLRPDEAAAQDTAAKAEGRKWPDWMRAVAELAIARGSTR